MKKYTKDCVISEYDIVTGTDATVVLRTGSMPEKFAKAIGDAKLYGHTVLLTIHNPEAMDIVKAYVDEREAILFHQNANEMPGSCVGDCCDDGIEAHQTEAKRLLKHLEDIFERAGI